MNTKLTFRNNLHCTETTVQVDEGLTDQQRKRIHRKLCPAQSTCTCGGLRGPQDRLAEVVWAGFTVEAAKRKVQAEDEYMSQVTTGSQEVNP